MTTTARSNSENDVPLLSVSEIPPAKSSAGDQLRARHLQREVFDRAPVAVICLDNRTCITYANPEAHQMFGFESGSGLEGQYMGNLVPDHRNVKILRKEINRRIRGRTGDYALTFKRCDGRKIRALIAGIPLYEGDTVVGTVGIIRDITATHAVQAILRCARHDLSAGRLLASLADELAKVVPFDMMFVSTFSADHQLARPIFERYEGERLEKLYNWYPLPLELSDWIRSPEIRIVRNLEEFLFDKGLAAEAKNPKGLVARGVKSFIRVPIFSGTKLLASLALFSYRPNFYDQRDRGILSRLPIVDIIRASLNRIALEHQQFRYELLRDISASTSNDELSHIIAAALVKHYGWHNVAIIGVDLHHERFALQTQVKAADGYELPSHYTQRLSEGLLGFVYNSGRPLAVNDVYNNEEFGNIYVKSNDKTVSEMCVPVFIESNIQWIVNIEDARRYAFSKDDCREVESIIQDVALTLENMFKHHALDVVFDNASTAVFVVNKEGRIRRANRAAEILLGVASGSLQNRLIVQFFADPSLANEFLQIEGTSSEEAVDLCRADGVPVRVLLSGFRLPSVFARHFLIARTLEPLERLAINEDLAQIAAELAAQTRTPLSLVFTWVQRLMHRVADEMAEPRRGEVMELLDKTIRQLHKLRVGSDRFSFSTDLPEPARVSCRIECLVEEALSEFPSAETKGVRVVLSDDLPPLLGDPYQISFCIQTIVAFVVRFAPSERPIELRASGLGTMLQLTVEGFLGTEKRPEGGAPLRSAQIANELALGRAVIERIAKQHGGGLSVQHRDDGAIMFNLVFPGMDAGHGTSPCSHA